MYQSPDFVKVNMNVEDVYSEYPTDPKPCEPNYFKGYNLSKSTCDDKAEYYGDFEYTSKPSSAYFDNLSNCWTLLTES